MSGHDEGNRQMRTLPATRALFGYDVVSSSKNADDELDEVRSTAAGFIAEAFALAGVDTNGRANYSPTGDGSLAAYPENSLPALIDAMYQLNESLAGHNRRVRPAIRLRASIHAAPVTTTGTESFQRPTIELARGLDAPAFKEIVKRMRQYQPVAAVALILSDNAYRIAVRGRYTTSTTAPLRGDLGGEQGTRRPLLGLGAGVGCRARTRTRRGGTRRHGQ